MLSICCPNWATWTPIMLWKYLHTSYLSLSVVNISPFRFVTSIRAFVACVFVSFSSLLVSLPVSLLVSLRLLAHLFSYPFPSLFSYPFSPSFSYPFSSLFSSLLAFLLVSFSYPSRLLARLFSISIFASRYVFDFEIIWCRQVINGNALRRGWGLGGLLILYYNITFCNTSNNNTKEKKELYILVSHHRVINIT